MQKTFHVFSGDGYYPQSGLGDYQGSYYTEEEARAVCVAEKEKQDWAVIIKTAEDGSLVEL